MARPQAPSLEPQHESLSRSAEIVPAAAADAAPVRQLLEQCGLPVDDLPDDLAGFVVARKAGRICGVAGLQRLGAAGLFRSLAVAEGSRGAGIARALCEAIFAQAQASGLSRLYLLTAGAERYFARLGFRRIERSESPPELRGTAQFASLCPDSAAVMVRVIR